MTPSVLWLLACGETNLTKLNEPPIVSFVSPADGASFNEDEALTFTASIADDHDEGDTLVYAWTFADGSAMVGQLEQVADGVRYSVSDGLPDGDYTLTLTVSDSGYQSGSDSLSFRVIDNTAPRVSFAAPLDGSTHSDGDTIAVDVVVEDDEEDDLNTLTLSWGGDLASGAPEHPTSDGHARFTVPQQAAGEHSLSVTVADSLGSTAFAELQIDVLAADGDGDGYPSADFAGDDCDDGDAGIHPGADEQCDGVDEDCDGDTDEAAIDAPTWYADADGDGFGDALSPAAACAAPGGHVADATDCDDDDSAQFPGADESCNGEDDDCDGTTDEDDAVDALDWYEDLDADGWGDLALGTSCEAPPAGSSAAGDCDDTDAGVNPGAVETCDGVDEDCDASIDEDAADADLWYPDSDGDGAGDPAGARASCTSVVDHVSNGDDCDDTDPARLPGAPERCNGADDDCDGLADDDDDDVVDPASWYADGDGDGFGDATSVALGCLAPAGHVGDDADCDDGAAAIHPGATETCSTAADDDCDGEANEPDASACVAWYADLDADGYGDGASSCLCEASAELTTTTPGDCDDDDDSTNPGASDRCEDGRDQDCDGFDAPCPLEGEISALSYDQKIVGNSKNLLVGQEICFIPDMDADGFDEIAISSVYSSSSAGSVWILPGEGSGSVSLSLAEAAITGATASDNFGNALASGDVNGDGVGDLLVGSYLSDEGGGQSGGAWAYLGPITAGVWTASTHEDVGWYGAAAADYFGSAVAVIPDVDGDGADEVAIGAIYQDSGGSNAGSVYLQMGPLVTTSSHVSSASMDVEINGEDANDYLGASLAGGIDFDGDGLEDLLLSAYGDDTIASSAGAVYVASGVVGLPSVVDAASLDWKFGGDVANDSWGYSTTGHPLTSIGDFDADGYDDLAVGAYTADDVATNAGAVYVIAGRSGAGGTFAMAAEGTKLYGDSAGDEFGYTLSGGDDLDGDGFDDFVVGGHYDDDGGSNAGAAWIYYGNSSADLSAWGAKLKGESAGDEAGIRVSMGGDGNGDGYGDILFGADYDDDGATDAGAGYLFSGAPR